MTTNLNDTIEQQSAIIDNKDNYGKKIKPVTAPKQQLSTKPEDDLVNTIIDKGIKGGLDIGEINKFTQISQQREQLYKLLDKLKNKISSHKSK